MRKGSRGFTLLEVMITVAIAGIMLAISVMAVSGLGSRARASTFLGELALDIPATRLIAGRYSQPAVLVFNCDTNGANEGQNGYWIYREVVPGQINLADLSTLPAPSANLAREKFVPMGRCVLAAPKPTNSLSKFHASINYFPWKTLFVAADAQTLSCTFCSTYNSTASRGAIRVLPDGRMFMSFGGDTKGGGVIFARSQLDSGLVDQALGILVPSGMTRLF